MHCAFCKTLITEERIGFRDECSRCDGDLHICLNCRFYDRHAANQCREPAIHEVENDKERRNLCEYFKPARQGSETDGDSAREATRRELDALFK